MAGENQNGQTGTSTPGNPAPSPTNHNGDSGDAISKELRGILSEIRKAPVDEATKKILADNAKLRHQRAELRERVKSLPPDGAVVLQGEDAKRWAAYQALGDPTKLAARLTEADADRQAVVGFRTAELHAKAAESAGMNAKVLSGCVKTSGVEIVLKEEKEQDGTAVSVPHVKHDGDKLTPLVEYADTHWREYLPALMAEADSSAARPPTPRPRPAGTPPRATHPRQFPAPGRDADAEHFERMARHPRYQGL